MAKAEEFRNEITSKIITALENGTAPWQQPWNGAEAPQNGLTKHQYSGINTVILSIEAMKIDGGKDPRWYTYRQIEQISQMRQAEQAEHVAAQEAQGHQADSSNTSNTSNTSDSSDGADRADGSDRTVRTERIHVRKGEKGTKVLLWKPTIGTDEHGNREITSVLQRTFTVFHASQIEGLPAYNPPEINIIEAHEKAEKIIADSGVRIFFGGGEAFYKPAEDYIQMPPREDFKSQEGYYSTVLHELTHATAHPSRLNREQRCGKFSAEYAFEELIAELGSLFIASSARIPQSDLEFQNHASYIESWLKNLRNDNMYIFRAAAEASKAAGFLMKNAEQDSHELEENGQ